MPETRFPGDPLTRQQRAALIQANLQMPQVHHPACACCKAKREQPSGPRP